MPKPATPILWTLAPSPRPPDRVIHILRLATRMVRVAATPTPAAIWRSPGRLPVRLLLVVEPVVFTFQFKLEVQPQIGRLVINGKALPATPTPALPPPPLPALPAPKV